MRETPETVMSFQLGDLSVINIFTNNIQKHSVYVHLICFSLHESFMIFFNFLTVCDENTTEHSSWSSRNKSSSHQKPSVIFSLNNNIKHCQAFLLGSYLVSRKAFKWKTIHHNPTPTAILFMILSLLPKLCSSWVISILSSWIYFANNSFSCDLACRYMSNLVGLMPKWKT